MAGLQRFLSWMPAWAPGAIVLVAALPGFGALFLRVYENSLVRQTEAELVAQSAALSAVAAVEWPGVRRQVPPIVDTPAPPSIDVSVP